MNTYFIKIRIESDTRTDEFLFLNENECVQKYTSVSSALQERKKIIERLSELGNKAKVLLCNNRGTLAPITEEDLGELDAIELDQFYGDFLTDEDKAKLQAAFHNESIDDEDYVQLQYEVIYDRLSGLDLLV